MRKRYLIDAAKNEKGFTLVETFVAITILMIAVLGPMSMLSTALRDARYIGNQITTTYLAQEGTELMIDYRNNKSRAEFDALISGSGEYYFDNLMLTGPTPCPVSSGCPALLYDDTYGYQYKNGKASIFSRTIKVSQVAPGQFLVVSSANWSGSTRPPTVSSSIIFRKI